MTDNFEFDVDETMHGTLYIRPTDPDPANLPAVIQSPVWAAEEVVSFEGWNHQFLVVKLPVRRVDGDPLPAGTARKLQAIFDAGSPEAAARFVSRLGLDS